MKKVFKLKDLDCANCAAKMEAGIKKIPGVTNASVNFMMQKMTIESDTEDFDALMQDVIKVCAKIEPDCEILMKSGK
jgi:copper chaperone CopZ